MQDESQFAVIMNNDIFLMNNAIDLMIEDLQNDKDISFGKKNIEQLVDLLAEKTGSIW